MEFDNLDEAFKTAMVAEKPEPRLKASTNIVREEFQAKNDATNKQKINLKADEYERICRSLILHVKQQERASEKGVRQGELQEWFIAQNISIVNTMEEYNRMQAILKSVINRQLKNERNMMISEDNADPLQRWIKMHPNYQED